MDLPEREDPARRHASRVPDGPRRHGMRTQFTTCLKSDGYRHQIEEEWPWR